MPNSILSSFVLIARDMPSNPCDFKLKEFFLDVSGRNARAAPCCWGWGVLPKKLRSFRS